MSIFHRTSTTSDDLRHSEALWCGSSRHLAKPIPNTHKVSVLTMVDNVVRRISSGEAGRFFKIFLTVHRGTAATTTRPAGQSDLNWALTLGQVGYGYVTRRDDRRFDLYSGGKVMSPHRFQNGRIFEAKRVPVQPEVSIALSSWALRDRVVDPAPADLLLRVMLANLVNGKNDKDDAGDRVRRLLDQVPLPPQEELKEGNVVWARQAVRVLQENHLVRPMDVDGLFTGAFYRAMGVLADAPWAKDMWNLGPQKLKAY